MIESVSENNESLADRIVNSRSSKDVVATTLKTDERVISRVTDGIYRQPGSALRELVSNAYDADATRVVIKTDAPRFARITVEDNGHGMTPGALAHLIEHIGGSAKRSVEGFGLGVTSEDSAFRSPGGRRLIGKIGIGLFSVSQLTRSFQIITKVRDDPFRTIATVSLKQYSESESQQKNEGNKFESGKVNIWREPASDVESHGTFIVLTKIRPQARDTLRSRDIWAAIEQEEKSRGESNAKDALLAGPNFHVGRVDVETGQLVVDGDYYRNVPWDESDSEEEAFKKLVKSVWDQVKVGGNPNPKLSRLFDYYLQMAWQLSLSIPLPYIDGHIFDKEIDDPNYFYLLSNDTKKGVAKRLDSGLGKTVGQAAGLTLGGEEDESLTFDVFFDDLKLFRPIRFNDLPKTNHAIVRPMVFVGKCEEGFDGVSPDVSGGPLRFEAYLFWNPKIAPTEHRGSLIRIHGASGTLFDPQFMRYQVAELTRLSQITCEIFVQDGLDGALNIDRESFNSAHPHSVYLARWLHGAIRQLATSQKKLAQFIRESGRDATRSDAIGRIRSIAREEWRRVSGDEGSQPPSFKFTDDEQEELFKEEVEEFYSFNKGRVFTSKESQTKRSVDPVIQVKVEAIGQIMASYGVFDSLSQVQQSELLRAIYEVMVSE